MNPCNLCLESASRVVGQPWNDPLFETRNFAALPSVGALVEGWLLLVPKRHFISFGALPDSMLGEMQAFKELVCSVLTACYGPVRRIRTGIVKLTKSSSIDPPDIGLQPVSNPPC